jgi:hypothetical protein
MPESVYDVILLIGSSKESWEKAAANAIEQASRSLRNLRVAEIAELDMQLDATGKVEAYRAKVDLITRRNAVRAYRNAHAKKCTPCANLRPPRLLV